MSESPRPLDKLFASLQERNKELNCLYQIEELLNDPAQTLDAVFPGVIAAMPPAWRFPDLCMVRITFENTSWQSPEFVETPWRIRAEITVQGQKQGRLEVLYRKDAPEGGNGPFLHEETKLTQTIADRLGQFIQFQRLRTAMQDWQASRQIVAEDSKGEWRVVVDLLSRTDQNLIRRITQKMLIRLCWMGISEAEQLFQSLGSGRKTEAATDPYENRPSERDHFMDFAALTRQVFAIAADHLSDAEILPGVQKWVQEDRSSFLVKTLASYSSSMTEIVEAVRRFQQMAGEIELSPATQKEVRVSLIRRFFTEQLDYINVAKDYVEISDFFDLLNRIIYPPDSHGQLGGKSAGLFLASRIVRQSSAQMDVLRNIKVPKTWYIASDGLLSFTNYNNLGELVEHKYKEIDQIRREYGQIVQLFKHSNFTPEIVQGLSMALDDFEERPLIVRSSSLLEDRLSAAFSGKYKSLFLANQGTKRERLEALMDAVAEVYSSTFGPDPIEYRAERGLLDFPEEMGIMIQEVVGTQIGKYLMPVYAGVAFSHNEFRWSPRIRREDGLVRLVMGLGTRAVDRLADDYPVLVAPGQPGLRVNITTEEVMRYAPNKIDLINLETNSFETVDARDFLRDYGELVPAIHNMVSLLRDHQIQRPTGLHLDADRNELGDYLRRPRDAHAVHEADARDPDVVAGEAGHAGGHRVCLGRQRLLSAAMPTAVLFARRGADADSARYPAGADPVYGQPLRIQRARARHFAHRLRRSRALHRNHGPEDADGRGPGGGTAERALAPAALYPHGTRTLGQPRRHQARRECDVFGDQEHGGAGGNRAQTRQLCARPLLRHALLSGSCRVFDSLPAALPR